MAALRAAACLVAVSGVIAFPIAETHAVEADTFSPIVSYQYQDALGDTPGQQVISPIVSYQYFDWPGDENLTFQNSPNVSYFSGTIPR